MLKLVVNRSNQEPLSPGVQTGQYFMAWEETDLTQMKKVIYKKVGEVTDAAGKTTFIFRWVDIDNDNREWKNNNGIWEFISHL